MRGYCLEFGKLPRKLDIRDIVNRKFGMELSHEHGNPGVWISILLFTGPFSSLPRKAKKGSHVMEGVEEVVHLIL